MSHEKELLKSLWVQARAQPVPTTCCVNLSKDFRVANPKP